MKRVLFLLPGLLIILMGCRTHHELTEQQKESILNAVKERSHEFWIVNNQKYDETSFQKGMSFYDENSDQLWSTEPATGVFNIGIVKTRVEWENDLKKMLDSRISTNPTITESHFAVLSKDLVLEVNKGDYTVTGKDSTVRGPFTMVNTCVWINREGEWKMFHFHESWQRKKEQ